MEVPEKRCSTCHLIRPLTEYNKRQRAPDGLQSRCRSCSRDWYLANRVQHMGNVRARNDRVRAENKRLLEEYLAAHPCVDCGEADLRVLDLDHEDPENKLAEVGRLIAHGLNWKRVAEEISKCSVRCANCHRRRTAASAGWWRDAAESRRRAAEHAQVLRRLEVVVPVGG